MGTGGTSVMKVKGEVQAPRLNYVHPICFEAGKPLEFVACGSNLLQSKFRYGIGSMGLYILSSLFLFVQWFIAVFVNSQLVWINLFFWRWGVGCFDLASLSHNECSQLLITQILWKRRYLRLLT
jgi:hypothetical protein